MAYAEIIIRTYFYGCYFFLYFFIRIIRYQLQGHIWTFYGPEKHILVDFSLSLFLKKYYFFFYVRYVYFIIDNVSSQKIQLTILYLSHIIYAYATFSNQYSHTSIRTLTYIM